jgi:hypothetical protein
MATAWSSASLMSCAWLVAVKDALCRREIYVDGAARWA